MIQSVQRISQILNLFRNFTSLSLAQISEKTGLPKTTAYGLVSSLKEEGFLEQDPDSRRYSLGLTIFELSSYFHARKDLRAISIPFINGLAQELGFTSQLAVLDKNQVVYLYKKTTDDFLTFSISAGLRAPFYCTATGKAIAAFLPDEERKTLLSMQEYVPLTPYSITGREEMEQVLDLVKQRGYGLDLNESEQGLGGLAVPLFEQHSRVVGAISISFLSDQYSEAFLARLLPPLQSCADQIYRRLS